MPFLNLKQGDYYKLIEKYTQWTRLKQWVANAYRSLKWYHRMNCRSISGKVYLMWSIYSHHTMIHSLSSGITHTK